MAKLRRNPHRPVPEPFREGRRFELSVADLLERELSNSYEVVPDVIIDNSGPKGGGVGAATRRDIDLVVVGPNGVFLLEAKSYAGWVEGPLWGFWHLTKPAKDGGREGHTKSTDRREAVALEERIYRVAALIEKYLRQEDLPHLAPYKKVRGIFVFSEGTSADLRAKDGAPVHPQADVRAVNYSQLVKSIAEAPPPRSAPPLPFEYVRRLSEVIDRGLVARPAAPAASARVVGQFKLEQELSKDRAPNGLTYTIYKARDLNTDMPRRAKYYDWAPMEKKMRERWAGLVRRHQRVLSALSPNRYIHQIITAVIDEETHGYVVVEQWTDHKPLHEVLNSRADLDRLDRDAFMVDLARGVRLIHSNNFVHRELSPKSVFVDADGSRAVLSNFELTKMTGAHAGAAEDEISTAFTKHVPLNNYRAPEIMVSPHEADERADVYSWAAIYFRLATGHPFRNEAAAFDEILSADLNDDVKLLVARCLEADPADRPANMGVVLDALGEVTRPAAE